MSHLGLPAGLKPRPLGTDACVDGVMDMEILNCLVEFTGHDCFQFTMRPPRHLNQRAESKNAAAERNESE